MRRHPGTVQQPLIIDYLRALRRYVGDRTVILLWDRLPAHRGRRLCDYINHNASWLTVEYLPPYAPELNPVEYFWSHLSRTDLANYIGEDLNAVCRQARAGASCVRHRPDIGRGFVKHSGLF